MGSVRLDPALEKQLRQFAAAEGVTLSEVYRHALTQYCNHVLFVGQITTRFMPALTRMAEQLAQEFPGMNVNVYSCPVGAKTKWQGHEWGIDCHFPNAPEKMPDNTYLSIEAGHLSTEPIINASVGWPVHKRIFSEYRSADSGTIEHVQQELPALFEALRRSFFEAGDAIRIP